MRSTRSRYREETIHEFNIQVLRSNTVINARFIRQTIESKTNIPVENQVLVDDNGLIIDYDQAVPLGSNLHLAVIGDAPFEAESWLRDNGISPFKTFKLRFLTKVDSLNITEYNTIYKVKRFHQTGY